MNKLIVLLICSLVGCADAPQQSKLCVKDQFVIVAPTLPMYDSRKELMLPAPLMLK